MKNILRLLFLGIIYTAISCGPQDPNQQIDEGKVEGETYTSQEIGWTMQIPQGWDIISKNKLEQSTADGMEMIEETGIEVDYSGLKYLISFKKDQFNSFQSTTEPFKLEYEGEWEENNLALKQIIVEAFTQQGINVDTASSKAEIDGLAFEVFHTKVYSPAGDIILYQDMYSRYINGLDFGAVLNYNNDADKKTLTDLLMNSKFKKEM